MGGNYEKGVYNQLMEVMEKLNAVESKQKKASAALQSEGGTNMYIHTITSPRAVSLSSSYRIRSG